MFSYLLTGVRKKTLTLVLVKKIKTKTLQEYKKAVSLRAETPMT